MSTMNAAGPAAVHAEPDVVRVEKPQDGRALTLRLQGPARLDFSAVAGEPMTLVRVGDSLVVLFDDRTTLTLAPFYAGDGGPRTDLAIDLGASRIVTGAEFAELFPIGTDPSVLPAAGPGPTSAAAFAETAVDALGGGSGPLALVSGLDGGNGTGGGRDSAPLSTRPIAIDDDNAADPVVEAGVLGGNEAFSGDDSATGSLLANDVGDRLAVIAVAAAGDSADGLAGTAIRGVYGTLVVDADGHWTYTLDNADADTDALAQGEQGSDVFRYTVQDRTGHLASATLTIALTGTNDLPIVTGADTVGAFVERADGSDGENAGELAASGTIAFYDVDLSNSHIAGVSLVSATGSALGATTARGALQATISDATTGDGHGAATWRYTVAAGALDDLAQDETLIEVYRVTLTDSSGATATSTVTITLSGTNDRPVIDGTSVLTGMIGEMPEVTGADAALSQGGRIDFSDTDLTDLHSVGAPTLSSAVWHHDGIDTTLGDGLGTLTLGALNQASDSIGWTFNVVDKALDFLAEGETLTFTYNVTLADDSGAVNDAVSVPIVVTVTGENDTAVISSTPYFLALDSFESGLDWQTSGWVFHDDVFASTGAYSAFLIGSDGENDMFDARDDDIEAMLGLSAGALDAAAGADAGDGSAIGQTYTLTAGTYTLSFDWTYYTGSAYYETGTLGDFAFVSIDGVVHVITNPGNLVDGWTDWTDASITFTTDGGPVSIGFGVMNVADETYEGVLNIDTVALVSVPSDVGRVVEDGQSTASGRLIVTDADHDQSAARVVATPTTSDKGYGTYTITADGTWVYRLDNTDPAVQALIAGQTLTDTFTFTSQDGSAAKTITISIRGTDDIAVIEGTDSGTVVEDGDIEATGRLTVIDSDTGQASVQPVFVPHLSDKGYGTYTLSADGVWIYTLRTSLIPIQILAVGSTLTDTFTVFSADGSASEAVTITITGTNDAPNVMAASGSLSEDRASVQVRLAGDDIDSDDDATSITYEIVSGPAAGHGTATTNGRALTFSPGTDFQYLGQGESVDVAISYRAVDSHGAASQTASVTVTVTGANDAPIITYTTGNDLGGVTEDAVGAATGKLVGADVDNAAQLTWSIVNGQGAYGQLTVDATGKWTYVLDEAAANSLTDTSHPTETFTIRVTDERGATDEQTVTITVNGSNDAPIATGEHYRINADTPLILAKPGLLANDTDVDSGTLKVVLVDGVAHGTLSIDENGAFVYIPTAGYTGDDSFTYRVSDGSSESNLVTVAIHVNDAPTLDLDADNSAAPGTGYATTYTEGGSGVAIVDDDIHIADSDNSSIERAVVTLTNAQAGDRLVVNGTLPAGLSVSFDAGALTIAGSASLATYEAILKQITFTNDNGNVGYGDRTITVTVGDGTATSNTATTTVHVVPYDDPPALTSLLENDNVYEQQAGHVVATFTVNDPDTLSGLSFSVKDDNFPWYTIRAVGNTVFGEVGTYDIVATGHFVYDTENADGDPTVTQVLQISDGTSTVEVPFTFTVTDLTAPPQLAYDHIVTNAGAGWSIEIPDAVLLRNDTDPDSALSVTGASGAVHFGSEVIYTTPADFPITHGTFPVSYSGTFEYNAFDGAWNRAGPAYVSGVAGQTINGTIYKDILVAGVPVDAVGNLNMTADANPSTFGNGHLVNEYVGQTFVAAGGQAQEVAFALDHVSGGDVRFRLLVVAIDSAADPDPTQVLFTSDVLTLAAGSGPTGFEVSLGGLVLDAGQTYAIVLDAYSPDGTQGVASVVSSTGYADGVFLSLNPDGGSQAEHIHADWNADAGWDMAFRITSTATDPVGSTLNGGRWDDSLIGNLGNDTLNGDEENDWLYGMGGDDMLNGGSGDDRLIGGAGDDRLTGGVGADIFVLDGPSQGLDHILDFSTDDSIEIDAAAFGLAAGTPAAAVFGSSSNASFDYAAGEQFHYDTSAHTLWYDGDGANGAAAIALARLESGAHLDASQVIVV